MRLLMLLTAVVCLHPTPDPSFLHLLSLERDGRRGMVMKKIHGD
jgi:hypothetical protein